MLKSIIIITYLICLPLSFLKAQSASTAEQDSLPLYWLNEIVVAENRLPLTIQAEMYKINSNDISLLDANEPTKAMQFAPGIHVTRITKNETTFKLRGFEQRQISVFLDGIPVSVPYDGRIDLAQLAGDNLEEIRISKGASSSLYGQNTLGGSINILTNAFSSAKKFKVHLEASDHRRYLSSLSYHNTFKALSYNLNFSMEQGEDFKLSGSFEPTEQENGGTRDNSDFKKNSFGLKLNYKISKRHSVGFNYNRINNEYNIPVESQTTRPRYWQFPEWQKNVFNLTSKHLFSDWAVLRSTIYLDTYDNLLKSYDDASYSSQDERWAWNSTYHDHSKGMIVYPTLKLFRFGSTNLVISYKNDVHKEQFRDFGFKTYETASWTAGIEQDIKLSESDMAVIGLDGNLLQALQADDLDLRDPILLYNGRVLYQHSFEDHFSSHLSFGQKTRFPTLKELYSERLGRTIANPELKEEQAQNYELGIKYQIPQGYIQAALFHSNLTNLIVQKEIGDETEQMQNLGKAYMQGFEFDFKYNFGSLNLMTNYTFMRAKNTSAGALNKHLEYRPEHQANLFANWQFINSMSVTLESNLIAGQYYQNPTTLDMDKFDNYTLFNLKYNYKMFEFLNWYVRVNNITDKNYMSEYGVPMPGREFVTGLKIAL